MRYFCLILVSLFLVSCGSSSNDGDGAAPQAAPPTPITGKATPPVQDDAAKEDKYNFDDLPEPYRSANYNIGRRVFRLCASCHFLKGSMGNSVGPNLAGVFGREVGTASGFNYSNALKDASFVWTPEQLELWLQGPKTFLPGNRMIFQGVKKESERTAVIAFIMKETEYTEGE